MSSSATGMNVTSASTVSYNGIQIDQIIRSKVSSTPVYNKAGTAIKYVTHIFEIEAFVYPSSVGGTTLGTTDGDLEIIRQALLQRGKNFYYDDKGYGENVSYVQGINPKDFNIGPRPVELIFEPVAGNTAARIVWSVEVSVVEACTTINYQNITEFWSKTRLSINKKGYKTIVREGYIELGAILNNDRLVNRASDVYKRLINRIKENDYMPGYHLEHDVDFSEDQKSCTFTLTYTEIESRYALPTGVVSIECTHSTSSKLMTTNPFQSGFRSWTNQIDCSVTLSPKIDISWAWFVFGVVASERINQGIRVPEDSIKNKKKITKVRVPIILSLRIEENIFSDTVSFSVEWVSFGRTIEESLNNTGILTPIQRTDWNDWTNYIRDKDQNLDGLYPMLDLGETTVLFDPCTSRQPSRGVKQNKPKAFTTGYPVFKPTAPPAESSYLDYKNKFELKSNTGETFHKRYKDEEETSRKVYLNILPDSTWEQSSGYDKNDKDTDYTIQDTGSDLSQIYMKGYSIRVGNPTTPPDLKTIGKVQVKKLDNDCISSNTLLTSNADFPIYLTTWEQTYQMFGYARGDMEAFRESTGESGDKV